MEDQIAPLEGGGPLIPGKYRVLSLLSRGGFGDVYLVEMASGIIPAKLALKLFSREFDLDEEKKAKFLKRISAAMGVVSKYIVPIRDFGETEGGQLYYTMDFCSGESLAVVLRREGMLPPERAIRIGMKILKALRVPHKAGVLHRDLKPSSILLLDRWDRESIRILNFGTASALLSVRKSSEVFDKCPHYVAPEQFKAGKLSFSADTYSAGSILYECLTGQKPFRGRNCEEVLRDRERRPPVPPDQVNPELSEYPGLSEVILRALDMSPERRQQSARELYKDLATLEKRSIRPAPSRPVVQGPAKGPLKKSFPIRAPARRRGPGSLDLLIGAAAAGLIVILILKYNPDLLNRLLAFLKDLF